MSEDQKITAPFRGQLTRPVHLSSLDVAGGLRAEVERRLNIFDLLYPAVKNIIYNVEQNPAAHTVPEIIHSLRTALGLKPGDRV